MLYLILAGLITAAPPQLEVRPLNGPALQGALISLDAKQLKISTDSGEKSLSIKELATASINPPPALVTEKPSVWVQLIGGSLVHGTNYVLKDKKIALTLLSGDTLELSPSAIRTVRFQAFDEGTQEHFKRITQADASGDVIIIRRAGKTLDELEGIVRGINEDTILFEFDGDKIPVDREKVFGIRYYQAAGKKLPAPVCQVLDTSGSRLMVQTASIQSDQLELQTVSGVTIKLPLSRLITLDFSSGNLVYLSDLAATQVEWMPYLGTRLASGRLNKLYEPRQDRGFSGQQLQLGNQTYPKGLAIHSRTSLIYRLTDAHKSFQAVAGIDPLMGDNGHVELVISGDNKELFREAISGKDKPVTINIDITGVRRLSILVDFGQQLDIADHLHLCNARITK
ncbi:MAG: NPCBM/NEW2 domain-containing protein [Pirellulaceae bacterium]|nr:NPCBM/NEW2 domain-containing protein [Pirellulaceae bacterium]